MHRTLVRSTSKAMTEYITVSTGLDIATKREYNLLWKRSRKLVLTIDLKDVRTWLG